MEQAQQLLAGASAQAAALFDRVVGPLRDAVAKIPFGTTVVATGALYVVYLVLAVIALVFLPNNSPGGEAFWLGDLAVYFSTVTHFTLTAGGFISLRDYNPYPILPALFLFLDLSQATALGAAAGAGGSTALYNAVKPPDADYMSRAEYRRGALVYGCWVIVVANLGCVYKSWRLWSDLRAGRRDAKTGQLDV